MAINLSKGQRVSLDKGLKSISVGLGWDPNQATGDDFDLDASTFMLGASGKIPTEEYFVFYNNRFSPDGSVEGAEDDTTGGASDGDDDEEIKVDLTKVSSEITEIVFVVTIHDHIARKQNFGQVGNSYIRIVDNNTNEEIMKYELDEDFSTEASVEFGRLYRRGAEWKFEAMGRGYETGLQFFVDKYV
ncbi:TerD family protein [Halosquirtibacter xylanolyticus]|uniref:TerD family protein n=1 Tax=Halosquirtibacter xylanolyticus TaxID=3374599 RepID=UPI003749DC5B|nr:TerD family protein [Prolixibacteraceae bacterium]